MPVAEPAQGPAKGQIRRKSRRADDVVNGLLLSSWSKVGVAAPLQCVEHEQMVGLHAAAREFGCFMTLLHRSFADIGLDGL